MAYGIVRTDKMFGTQNKAGLASFKFFTTEDNSLVEAAIENGNVVKIDGLISETTDNVTTILSREVYKAIAPTASADKKDILLVADPEVVVEKTYHTLGDFINKAGEVVRGYYLHTNDIFSVTADCLAGTPALGNLVELQAGTKLKAVASATNGSTTIGKIIQVEQVGSVTYYVIQVA